MRLVQDVAKVVEVDDCTVLEFNTPGLVVVVADKAASPSKRSEGGPRAIVTCPNCGDYEVAIEDITVQAVRGGDKGKYQVKCPKCGRLNEKKISRILIDICIAAGATWVIDSKKDE